jgi:hypothetical protein
MLNEILARERQQELWRKAEHERRGVGLRTDRPRSRPLLDGLSVVANDVSLRARSSDDGEPARDA